MQGASRQSMVEAREILAARAGETGFEGMAADLLAVSGAMADDSVLRGAATDPGTPGPARSALFSDLLAGRVGDPARAVVAEVVGLRWSTARDLVDAVESLAAEAAFRVAERDARIDRVESEIFSFGRILDASPELRSSLSDPAVADEAKGRLVRELLEGRAQPETVLLMGYAATHPRGRRLEHVTDELLQAAAVRREQVLAEVRVAAPMTDEQQRRLAAALSTIYGRPVTLQVVVDPTVLGGVVVRVGEEVIDGTIAHRLAEARRAFGG